MAEHDELVAEMLVLEQMGTQERQKLAKKRRLQQLKKWSQREKEWIAKEKQLNKRLASILNEENNGLNLKQYTTYNSNQRRKKRLTSSTAAANGKYNDIISGNNDNDISKTFLSDSNDDKSTNSNNGVHLDRKPVGSGINNNNLVTVDGPYANNLAPNGRVHFNVGVMLLEAAARNDYDEVKRLLCLGVSPDSVNHDGLTALHQCCIDASELIMNLLLEYGANVDARDTERWTPLHAACTCGHLNLVKILVEHGADLLAVNGDGNMPFDICEDEATLDYIESQMIKQGITQEMIDLTRASSEIQMLASLEELAASKKDGNLNNVDENGVSQLHIAATNNYISVVKFLLKHGVNINVCDNDRWTPLHGLACWGNEQHIKVAEMLVEAGADLTAKTSNEETVFDLCDNAGLLERLNQLKDELESKQASGADRLRRTQSRTNSRVHSVRRTRVQDKNQISRREAREEALLRVESSENTNVSAVGSEQVSSSSMDSNKETSVANVQSSATSTVDSKIDTSPVETNLDREPSANDDGIEPDECQPASIYQPESVDETKLDSARSQASSVVTNKQDHHNGLTSEASRQPSGENLTTVLVSSSSSLGHSTGKINLTAGLPSANSGREACNPEERQTQQPAVVVHKGTSVVQVHLAPINYTLSNLKKHRSDLRLRGVSTTVPPVQLEPRPVRDESFEGMATQSGHANGWPGSLIKFHGQPSEIIEENRREHKCCVII